MKELEKKLQESFEEYCSKMMCNHSFEDPTLVRKIMHSAYLFGAGVGIQLVAEDLRRRPVRLFEKEVKPDVGTEEPEAVHPDPTGQSTPVSEE